MAQIKKPKKRVITKTKPKNWKLMYDKYRRMAVKNNITPLSYRDFLITGGIEL